MKSVRHIFFLSLLCLAASCDEDKASFSIQPSLGFESTATNLSETNAGGVRVNLVSNARFTEPVTVTLTITNVGQVQYGVDYTTEPAASGSTLTLTIDADNETPGFFVYPTPGTDEVRKVLFEISSIVGSGLQLAQASAITHSLSILKVTEPQTIVSYAFEDCQTAPVGPTERIVAGAMTASTWLCTSFGYPDETTRATEANAFGKGSGTSNAYLVFPAIDGNTFNELTISMLVYSRFTGSGDIKVRYSSNYSGDGDPEAAGVTWTDLETLNNQLPADGSRVWTTVTGTITDVSGANFYVAIQYIGATSSSASNWRIDNLEIKGN